MWGIPSTFRRFWTPTSVWIEDHFTRFLTQADFWYQAARSGSSTGNCWILRLAIKSSTVWCRLSTKKQESLISFWRERWTEQNSMSCGFFRPWPSKICWSHRLDCALILLTILTIEFLSSWKGEKNSKKRKHTNSKEFSREASIIGSDIFNILNIFVPKNYKKNEFSEFCQEILEQAKRFKVTPQGDPKFIDILLNSEELSDREIQDEVSTLILAVSKTAKLFLLLFDSLLV